MALLFSAVTVTANDDKIELLEMTQQVFLLAGFRENMMIWRIGRNSMTF